MNFEQWLAANGYDPAQLNDTQQKHLQAAWKEDTKKPDESEKGSGAFQKKMKAIDDEEHRIEVIQSATLTACERNRGNPVKIKKLQEICAAAIADTTTDQRDFQLALLQADRSLGSIAMHSTGNQKILDDTILEAAVAKSIGLQNVDKKYPDQVLQAAHTHFKRGIGLLELLQVAGRRNNGYDGSIQDHEALCRAAFGRSEVGEVYAAGTPTTVNVPGILSNVANKVLEETFGYGEPAWRQISRIRPMRDFKQMSLYRLDGAGKFKLVPKGGEIKAATLSELTYTLQADLFGAYIGIDYRDIVNDDLGAFSQANEILARGAIDSLNEVFWTEWLDDSAFFNTDKSKLNYDDGATDSVLSLAGLDNASTIFKQQIKADGTPMGTEPRILLVPVTLENTAMNLMAGPITAAAQSTPLVSTTNVFTGRYTVVSSRYLCNSNITGYSATAWYLLASPNDLPVINVGFLNGQERPTVEQSEFDFKTLGLAMRAYMAWGCKKAEYRGGLKLKGAA